MLAVVSTPVGSSVIRLTTSAYPTIRASRVSFHFLSRSRIRHTLSMGYTPSNCC